MTPPLLTHKNRPFPPLFFSLFPSVTLLQMLLVCVLILKPVMFSANVEYTTWLGQGKGTEAEAAGTEGDEGDVKGNGKCMYTCVSVLYGYMRARFIVFICSWPTETVPRLSSLRDCTTRGDWGFDCWCCYRTHRINKYFNSMEPYATDRWRHLVSYSEWLADHDKS